MDLTKKEKEKLDSKMSKGINTVKFTNIMVKAYNQLCSKCRTKIIGTVSKRSSKRTSILGDLKNYCPACQRKLKPVVKKLEAL